MAGTGAPSGPTQRRGNALGIVALVAGILSCGVCPIVMSIVAIIYGRRGLAAVRAGDADNPGLARTGLILGIVTLVLGILGAMYAIFAAVVLSSPGGLSG